MSGQPTIASFFTRKTPSKTPSKAPSKTLKARLQTLYAHPTLDAKLLVAPLADWTGAVKKALESAQPSFRVREIQMGGKWRPQKRATCFMAGPGVPGFSYSGQTTDPDPLTAPVKAVLDRVNEALGLAFNGVLLNFYEASPTSGIGFHSDAPTGLGAGGTVVSISFGAPRTFRVKDKATLKTLVSHKTGPCELMVMAGTDFQPTLLHGIPAMAKAGRRWSLTFRQHAVPKLGPKRVLNP
jgi:alkylated DNA repair dioxygenase AlkB